MEPTRGALFCRLNHVIDSCSFCGTLVVVILYVQPINGLFLKKFELNGMGHIWLIISL